jgi:Family of unknown function (DUF5670)
VLPPLLVFRSNAIVGLVTNTSESKYGKCLPCQKIIVILWNIVPLILELFFLNATCVHDLRLLNEARFFIYSKKIIYMGNLLYIIAVVFIIIWGISFLGGFYTGGLIHTLLVIAVIMIIVKLVRRA